MSEPRGIRNNNPGNIEKGAPWQGLDDPADDGRFCRFKSPEYGIRAIARIMITYQDKYGINTPHSIVNRWAPPHENDTGAYAKHVAEVLDIGEHSTFDVHCYGFMKPLVETIIKHENGKQPYSDEQIDRGLLLAGVEP
jgi:hypothetical protein